MSHTQLQTGVLAGATQALQKIESLSLQRRQLAERQEQNLFQNVMSIAKQDPENAARIFNESPLRDKFGEIKFLGSRGDFSSFSFFNPESGQRQTAILNRSTGEFEPVGGAQAQRGGDIDALLREVLGPEAEPTPEPTPAAEPAPEVTPGELPEPLPAGDVGIGREVPGIVSPTPAREPLAETRIRVEITVGKDKGRTATVPERDFDPRSMRRIQ